MDGDSGRTDRDELREVVLAFVDKFRGAQSGPGKTRLQKFVFFADVYGVHWYGSRLTDADFKTYKYGAFSAEVADALDHLHETGAIEEIDNEYDGTQYNALREPRLNEEKREIIDEVWPHVMDLSRETLEQFSKGSWLYENTAFDTEMDWEAYEQFVGSPTKWRDVVESLDHRDPVDDDAEAVSELL